MELWPLTDKDRAGIENIAAQLEMLDKATPTCAPGSRRVPS